MVSFGKGSEQESDRMNRSFLGHALSTHGNVLRCAGMQAAEIIHGCAAATLSACLSTCLIWGHQGSSRKTGTVMSVSCALQLEPLSWPLDACLRLYDIGWNQGLMIELLSRC